MAKKDVTPIHMFINKSYNKNSDELLKKAILLYCQEKNIKFAKKTDGTDDIKIIRKDGQKPYMDDGNIDANIKFNISHTGEIFVCAIDDKEIGIDVQEVLLGRGEKYDDAKKLHKLAEKYFTENEHSFIIENGTRAFFDIWTYKEAYTKLLGKSIFHTIKNIETVAGGKLRDKIGDVYMTRIDIPNTSNLACAVASYRKENDICLKEIY